MWAYDILMDYSASRITTAPYTTQESKIWSAGLPRPSKGEEITVNT